jgi:hypothetical protein
MDPTLPHVLAAALFWIILFFVWIVEEARHNDGDSSHWS